jgi:hypothetical protein
MKNKGGNKMYLIGIKNGVHPLGNTGTLITRYKAPYKIKETAKRFATMYNHTEVYGLHAYPQKLCELENKDFINYVKQHGIQYV